MYFSYILEKSTNNDKLYQLLEVSRKKIAKKQNNHLELKIIRKIPYFLQPIRNYKILGDFIIQDSIFQEETTFKSNCMIAHMNDYKKITKISLDDSLNLLTLHLSSYTNATHPAIGLLIDRLSSLSNVQAKTLSSMIFQIYQMFSNTPASASIKNPSSLSNIKVNVENLLETFKNNMFKLLNPNKHFLVINAGFNHQINTMEIKEIVINMNLLQVLGYKPHEFIEQCLKIGFPGIMAFENYFSSLSEIIKTRLSGQQSRFHMKLLTADEEKLSCDVQTYSSRAIIDECIYTSFALEFDIHPWSLLEVKNNREKMKSNNDSNEPIKLMLQEKKMEVQNFMNKFYTNEFQERFQGKVFYNRAGYENINNGKI